MPQYFLCKMPLLYGLIAADTHPTPLPHPAESEICFPWKWLYSTAHLFISVLLLPLLSELKSVVHFYSSFKETCPQRQFLLCLEAWLTQVFMEKAANSFPWKKWPISFDLSAVCWPLSIIRLSSCYLEEACKAYKYNVDKICKLWAEERFIRRCISSLW